MNSMTDPSLTDTRGQGRTNSAGQLDGLRFRPFEVGDLAGIHHLVQRCFSGSGRSMAGEAWRFTATPAGVIPGMVALDGDRIVASYTAWPVSLYLGGELVQGAQSMDTMTDPDYRGRGLFVTLAAASYDYMAARGYDLIYGFPNDNSFPGFMRRLAWTHVGDVSTLKRLIAPVPDLLDPVSLVSSESWRGRLGRGSAWEFADDPASPASLTALVGLVTAPRNDDVHLRRDASWFGWRYSAASQHPYRTITATLDGTPDAAIVYHEEGNRGVIAETLGSQDALQAVIMHYLRLARQRGMRVVSVLTTDADTIEVLRRAGFWFRGQEKFIVRRLSQRPFKVDPFDLANWTLYSGDHDVY
jgi:GNAT superfamily N-acetyltransferase